MKNYKIVRLNYPGVLNLEIKKWTKFNNENFAFFIDGFQQGVAMFDPNNSIVYDGKKLKLNKAVDNISDEIIGIAPKPKNKSPLYHTVIEKDPVNGRCFYDQAYSVIYIVFDSKKEVTTIEKVQGFLTKIFIRYNSTYLQSSFLVPKSSYWQESIKIFEAEFNSKLNLDQIIASDLSETLSYTMVTAYFATSKHRSVPNTEAEMEPIKHLRDIPSRYMDVFELFASGLSQMNYNRNYKLAILECFIAVEILIVRVTDEQKILKGISKSKLNESKTKVDISYKMDIELKLFFDFNKKEESILGQIAKARTLRNKIMHQNSYFKEDEIKNVIGSINEFLFMLIEKANIK